MAWTWLSHTTTSTSRSDICNVLLHRNDNNYYHRKNFMQSKTTKDTQLRMIWSPNQENNIDTSTDLRAQIDASLHSDPSRMAQLAKLAVAFSPEQTKLSLRNVEYVTVLAVDADHMELEAVVCEDDGCITVFVPVRFPWSCGDGVGGVMEECVLNTVNDLDAQVQLSTSDYEPNNDHTNVFRYVDQHVVDVDDIEEQIVYPDWWVHAHDALWDECDNLRRILNEDNFQNEVKALVYYAHEMLEETARFELKKVKVMAVGPAGLLFRAKAMEENSDNISGSSILLEVPFSFGGTFTCGDQLRSAVLGAIAGVNMD
eukprot:CAMPEP_0116025532 /NCGR_PEP_ID=MMETSP0321-20121206/13123_1 /TAXON_ID=163516 /ORGANISM="Leptocylindrus danicus var. danicus, Strain B650" /LENGTH=313 /DNA_ID=CAMNT_0003497781 /DNA_START=91 /DNA_END=1032 /DNA_ORIENTATION=+